MIFTSGQAASDSANVIQLHSAEVYGNRAVDNYYSDAATGALRSDMPLPETPQNVRVLGRSRLDDIGALRLDDSLDQISGVARQHSFGGLWDNFSIRGSSGDGNTERFHWKWYFAMHQVADDRVRSDVAAYRQRLQDRDGFAEVAGILLPTIGLQRGFIALAATDLVDHLHYLDSVASFHDALRSFFYPRIFQDPPEHFPLEAFELLPVHEAHRGQPRWAAGAALGMLLWTLALLAGARLTLMRTAQPVRATRQAVSAS